MSATDLVFPSTTPLLLGRGLFSLAAVRGQPAKAVFAWTEDLCGLTEDAVPFTACGRQASEILCSPAKVLCVLANDLGQVSEQLVPPTTGLHREAEDLVFLPKGLRDAPTDLHQEPNGISSLVDDIWRCSRVLVEDAPTLFRLNKGHSVFPKSGASRSKRLSRLSTPLRLESESVFVESERLCR